MQDPSAVVPPRILAPPAASPWSARRRAGRHPIRHGAGVSVGQRLHAGVLQHGAVAYLAGAQQAALDGERAGYVDGLLQFWKGIQFFLLNKNVTVAWAFYTHYWNFNLDLDFFHEY